MLVEKMAVPCNIWRNGCFADDYGTSAK